MIPELKTGQMIPDAAQLHQLDKNKLWEKEIVEQKPNKLDYVMNVAGAIQRQNLVNLKPYFCHSTSKENSTH